MTSALKPESPETPSGHGAGSARPTEKFDVVVFGAGIAGLTVAHELMVRNYNVLVIDNAASDGMAVGGVAKTQIGHIARSRWNENEAQEPREASRGPMPLVCRISFDQKYDQGLRGAEEDLSRILKQREQVPEPRIDLFSYHSDLSTAETKGKEIAVELASRLGLGLDTFTVVALENQHRVETRDCAVLKPYFELPGEHGFRFFPSFYRNLFDTMRRTPLISDQQEGSKTEDEPGHSVYDNLCPTRELKLSFATDEKSFSIPRQLPRSLSAIADAFRQLHKSLGFSAVDVARIEKKLLQYATSCTERRKEYEDCSWSDFIGAKHFSEETRRYLDSSSQALGALRASDSDARTYGNTVLQLLLDQLGSGDHADFTLSGPTSEAWFSHWHHYLRREGVEFVSAQLADFKPGPGGRVLPEYKNWSPSDAEKEFTDRISEHAYFVLAVDLPEARRLAPKGATLGIEALAAVERFLKPNWDTELAKAAPEGPLKHLSGIQFFFREELHFIDGHILYPDAPWGLTSIAQTAHWFRYRGRWEGFRSVLSVDIGDWETPFDFGQGISRSAWNCTRVQIAKGVWRQIAGRLSAKARTLNQLLPWPAYFLLDGNIEFGNRDNLEDVPVADHSPFLVNLKGQYSLRPRMPLGDQAVSEVRRSHWVLAGNYVQTHTRLTTMEAPNESGRHAVNAILTAKWYHADLVPVVDLEEDLEPPDLRWLKELDRKLYERGAPHFLEILDPKELAFEALPTVVDRLLALVR